MPGCPKTNSFEILNDATATWETVVLNTNPIWATNDDGTSFTLETTDYAQFAGKTYQMRFVYESTDSTQTNKVTYDQFSVTFDYICFADQRTLAAIADTVYTLGSGT